MRGDLIESCHKQVQILNECIHAAGEDANLIAAFDLDALCQVSVRDELRAGDCLMQRQKNSANDVKPEKENTNDYRADHSLYQGSLRFECSRFCARRASL